MIETIDGETWYTCPPCEGAVMYGDYGWEHMCKDEKCEWFVDYGQEKVNG